MFTYSPLGKALEKQIKAIESQGEKQIKAIIVYKKQLDNTNAYSYEDKLLLSKERQTFKNIYNKSLNGRNVTIKFVSHYHSVILDAKRKATKREGLKILNSKQSLPITLTYVKAGNTFENLLNKIHQIIYYLYQAKEITKKVMNSTKL